MAQLMASGGKATFGLHGRQVRPSREIPESRTYRIPSYIDNTGATDVTNQINFWLGNIPDGEPNRPNVAVFDRGAIYRVAGSVGARFGESTSAAGNLRNHLTLDGNGCTIDGSQDMPPEWANRSHIGFIRSTNIEIKDFTILGTHPDPCLLLDPDDPNGQCRGGFNWPNEWNWGVGIFGCDGITVRDNRIYNAHGDGVGFQELTTVPYGQYSDSRNCLLENNIIDGTGRHGVSLTSSAHITIRGNVFDRISYQVVDLEPQISDVYDVVFEDNVIKRHRYGVMVGATGKCRPRSDYVIRNNVMEQWGSTSKGPIEFVSRLDCDPVPPLERLTVTGNVLRARGHNYNAVVKVRGWHDVTVTDNVLLGPTNRQSLVGLGDCTGTLVVKRNVTPTLPYAYHTDMLSLEPHGPGVDACGNTTAAGPDQPVACPP